jgi:hypothetical protein
MLRLSPSAAVLLAASASSAQTPEVRWTAPAGCPAREAVELEIARLLAQSDAAPLDVEGEVTTDSTGELLRSRLRLTIRSGDAEDARTLESTECATLASAAALLAALAVDPTVIERAAEEPETDDEAVALVSSLGDPIARPRRAPPEPSALAFEIGARASLDFGTMPSVAAGVGLAASFGAAFRVELGLGWFPERFAPVMGSSSVGGDLTLVTASLDAVWRVLDDDFAIAPRAGVEVGLFFGTGTGVTDPESAVVPVVLAAAGLEIAWRSARPFWAAVGGAVLIGLFRPRFRLDNVGEVHQVAPAGGRIWLTAGIEIP